MELVRPNDKHCGAIKRRLRWNFVGAQMKSRVNENEKQETLFNGTSLLELRMG